MLIASVPATYACYLRLFSSENEVLSCAIACLQCSGNLDHTRRPDAEISSMSISPQKERNYSSPSLNVVVTEIVRVSPLFSVNGAENDTWSKRLLQSPKTSLDQHRHYTRASPKMHTAPFLHDTNRPW